MPIFFLLPGRVTDSAISRVMFAKDRKSPRIVSSPPMSVIMVSRKTPRWNRQRRTVSRAICDISVGAGSPMSSYQRANGIPKIRFTRASRARGEKLLRIAASSSPKRSEFGLNARHVPCFGRRPPLRIAHVRAPDGVVCKPWSACVFDV